MCVVVYIDEGACDMMMIRGGGSGALLATPARSNWRRSVKLAVASGRKNTQTTGRRRQSLYFLPSNRCGQLSSTMHSRNASSQLRVIRGKKEEAEWFEPLSCKNWSTLAITLFISNQVLSTYFVWLFSLGFPIVPGSQKYSISRPAARDDKRTRDATHREGGRDR